MGVKHQIDRIKKRQMARFLSHLSGKGRLDAELETDVKRMLDFLISDIYTIIDEENDDAERNRTRI